MLGLFHWKFAEIMYSKQLSSHSQRHSFAWDYLLYWSVRFIVTALPVKYTNNTSWERSLFEEGYSKILTKRFEEVKDAAAEY